MPGVLTSFGDQLERLATTAEKTSGRIVAAAKSASNAMRTAQEKATGASTTGGKTGAGREPATKTLEKFASELGASVR